MIELERITGTGKTVRSYSNCRESIRNQFEIKFRQVVGKSLELVVFVWLRESKRNSEIQANIQIAFKMFEQRVASIVKLYVKQNKFCRPWKGLGTSLALQSYAVLASCGFLCSEVV